MLFRCGDCKILSGQGDPSDSSKCVSIIVDDVLSKLQALKPHLCRGCVTLFELAVSFVSFYQANFSLRDSNVMDFSLPTGLPLSLYFVEGEQA